MAKKEKRKGRERRGKCSESREGEEKMSGKKDTESEGKRKRKGK